MDLARRSMSSLLTAMLVIPLVAAAQTKPAWQHSYPSKIEAFTATPLGSVVVQLKKGVFAVDAETGKEIWSRPEVDEYLVVSGTTFVVLTSGESDTVASLESGQDLWKLSSLGFSTVRGKVHLPSRGLLLVYGQTPESQHTLTAVKYESGEVLWKQTSLYSDPVLAPKAQKMKYGLTLIDSDSSVVLDPSDDGLIRLDLTTGRVLWRFAETALDSKDDVSGLSAVDGRILVSYKKKLLAINQADGKVLWSRKEDFSTPVFQAVSTPSGLLIRGAYNLNNKGHASWNSFLAMLDPTTGATKWTNEKEDFKGRSSVLLEENQALIALEKGLATFDLATGAVVNTLAMVEFQGGEDPCCLERFPDGRLLVSSSQNLRVVKEGKVTQSLYFKAPGASFLAKLAVVALAAAASGAGAAIAGPGGFYNVYAPTQNSPLFQRFKATTEARSYIYVLQEEEGAAPDRFALVRIDKDSVQVGGRLKFTDRSPDFRVDGISGTVVVADGVVLSGLRFAPASPTPK